MNRRVGLEFRASYRLIGDLKYGPVTFGYGDQIQHALEGARAKLGGLSLSFGMTVKIG